ncbi:class I SAM-dependent methyltransferase [Actinomadura macrotermitis]|uniref:Ubiquinone/menaquinone biosynthesis C-methyltransferase UbiE n=1 Tax=Actinomadura macrotermitis TaxID=2585200 RepID=A0A7K0C6Z7_9ACTN|nr:class I SAM-dependent methyltransferase [Actinomadura macrotermitis]MQY09213.1 Ubiquinone/menaquinone biosynthesis C-methyltransferase UbiE [Actinomadura macrotermitis]
MILKDVTARYTPSEAWFYDRFIAGAVLATVSGLIDRLVAGVPADGSVLEVGSGGGRFALRLAERGAGLHVTGVDLSAGQVARAARRARAGTVAGRVGFQVGSALETAFPDEHFHAVVSIGSIKHWPDRDKGMAEMARVLRPGGLLLVAEVDRGCALADARAFVARLGLPRPLAEPALWGFRTYIAGQGLDLDEGRALVAGLPLVRAGAERLPGTPLLTISGVRRAAPDDAAGVR